jgi:hypothetical protein
MKLTITKAIKKILSFYATEGSLQSAQQPVIAPYPKAF